MRRWFLGWTLAVLPILAFGQSGAVDELGAATVAPPGPAMVMETSADQWLGSTVGSWSVYEDWAVACIRGDRWTMGGAGGQEARRELPGRSCLSAAGDQPHNQATDENDAGPFVGRLRLGAPTTTNSGFRVANQRMLMAKAAAMTQVAVAMQVKAYTAVGCRPNPGTGTRVRPVMVDFTAFNDGSSTGLGDATGDHFIRVAVHREAESTDPPHQLTINALIYRCLNSTCSTAASSIFNGSVGSVQLGRPFTIWAIWDAHGSRFVVGVDGTQAVLSYGPELARGPARVPFARLETQNVNINCSQHETVTDSQFRIHRVLTNQEAVVP